MFMVSLDVLVRCISLRGWQHGTNEEDMIKYHSPKPLAVLPLAKECRKSTHLSLCLWFFQYDWWHQFGYVEAGHGDLSSRYTRQFFTCLRLIAFHLTLVLPSRAKDHSQYRPPAPETYTILGLIVPWFSLIWKSNDHTLLEKGTRPVESAQKQHGGRAFGSSCTLLQLISNGILSLYCVLNGVFLLPIGHRTARFLVKILGK